MKLGPVTKLDKGNTTTSIKDNYNVMSTNRRVIVFFFRFMANLKPSGSWSLDTWSIKLMFSLTVIFYLTNHLNRIKKPVIQLLYHCFEQRYNF